MPTQNSAMWGQKSNRKLIIGIFGFCLGLFGILCGMFWVDLFDWIMQKVISTEFKIKNVLKVPLN